MLKNEIINELGTWLSDKGDIKFMDNYSWTEFYNESQLCPTPAIQQNSKELYEFIDVILDNKTKTALEVGLGYYGSTHFLWRLIFEKVITIECDWDRVREFGNNTKKHYGKYVLDDNKSYFVHGHSYNPKTVLTTREVLGEDKIDMLFIDGYHSFGSIMTDFLLYKNVVKHGGIIAFHDYLLPAVKRFVNNLGEGHIDGKKYEMNKIIHTTDMGIVWIRV
jgi:predicted O-methyltransferase YrrM